MPLSLQTFSSLVQTMSASLQGAATQLIDLSAGSALRAVLEANASIGLWMQWLIIQVLQTTRAATSSGADLDSWVADFSFARLPAAPSSGIVTFARYTAGGSVQIPVGSLVRTGDGTQTFAVTADMTNPAFSASAVAYVLGAGVPSLDVPVASQAAGTQGNVLPGTISLLVSAIPGLDTVMNAATFQNGRDAESDAAVRSRFRSFIDTRSRATPQAVGFAIATVQQGLTYALLENMDPSGAVRPGSFVVTVDDGSGSPSAALLSSVTSAIEAVRPVGSVLAVQPPTIVTANVAMSIAAGTGSAVPDLSSAVASALTGYINNLPIGALLSCSKLASIAYGVSPVISNVSSVTINGATADLGVPPSSVIKAGAVVAS